MTTEQQSAFDKAEVMLAFARGEKVEAQFCGRDCVFRRANNPTWSWATHDYRIAPQPKSRPWRQEDVPVACRVRVVGLMPQRIITEILDSSLQVKGVGWVSYAELADQYEYTLDGKTWQKCEVVE